MRVEFIGLQKKYKGKYALKDFTVSLENGIYGLLGTNGAGKTTLINLFMGIIKPDSGNIYINGENIQNVGVKFLDNIGYLPQYPQFYKDFTVEDFLKYMCVLKNMSPKLGRQRIEMLLPMVNLTDARTKKIGALSGGMRQRLGIAQAMLSDPEILILDEPTAGLDPQERIRFRNLISRFAGERIVILATHIVSDVEFIANQIILLNKGELMGAGNPTEMIEKLTGCVWELTLEEGDVPLELFPLQISNITRLETGIRLRVLASSKPHLKAVSVKANLEEVFLYFCGESKNDISSNMV